MYNNDNTNPTPFPNHYHHPLNNNNIVEREAYHIPMHESELTTIITSVMESRKDLPSCTRVIFSIIHILATLFFVILIIYALITNASNNTSVVCGNELWRLLLVHLVMPIAGGLTICIVTTLISPFLLSWTHKSPFWLLLLPLLTLVVYNATMLGLGVQSIHKAQNNSVCLEVLKDASKDLSPDLPLLIVLSWVFVGIDSLAVLCWAIALFFMFCIQTLSANS